MQSTKEKVSYCLGLKTAKNLLGQFADIDLHHLREGFDDAISDKKPRLGSEEVDGIMLKLREQVEMQQRDFIAKLSEQNRKEGENFLAENKDKPGVVTLSSGLQYQVLTPGSSQQKPTIADTVSVHYRGSFIDGQIFDTTYERGQPHTFPVSRVIPGWSEILQLMTVGSKYRVFIPHYLAYGDAGFGNEIPPCTLLIFEMELLSIQK